MGQENRIDELVFYYIDGKNFLKIFDKRNGVDTHIYDLNELEREILLACINVISFQGIKELLPHVSDGHLISILDVFKSKGIIFEENDHFFALPLRYAIIRMYGSSQIYCV